MFELKNVLKLVDPNTVNLITNRSLSLDTIKQNISHFLSQNSSPDFQSKISKDFSWFLQDNKEVPLLIQYLYFNLGKIVPVEEINQIHAHEQGDRYSSNHQWWHSWHDLGFDVETRDQYIASQKILLKQLLKEDKKKLEKELKSLKSVMKGLVLKSTNPGGKHLTRKKDLKDPLNWELKKIEYNYSCATCNTKEGERNYNGYLVTLEKGHIDPTKQVSHSNIIPQCGSCNNHKDHFYRQNLDGSWQII